MFYRISLSSIRRGFCFSHSITHKLGSCKKRFYQNVVDVNATISYNGPKSSDSLIGKWLLGLAGMSFGAVVLGGITSFVHENGEMSLSHFKFIWCMEYIHRMWGRSIGAAFAIPASFFLYKGYFSRSMKPRIFIYGLLIGLQGIMGWLMVRSGLKEPKRPIDLSSDEEYMGVPRVSHYLLCAHLSSAVVLYSLFLWSGLSHLISHPKVESFNGLKLFKILGHSTKALTFLTICFGAFVAGLDAGLVYNSWPKMANKWIPEDLILARYGSVMRNVVDNPVCVQFMHRLLAYSTVTCATLLWASVMRVGVLRTGPRIRRAAHMILFMAWGQSVLGISTLLNYVPIHLASMHQSNSLILFSTLLWFTHCLRAVPK